MKITTEAEYDLINDELDTLSGADEGTLNEKNQARLEELSQAISDYDDEHYPE